MRAGKRVFCFLIFLGLLASLGVRSGLDARPQPPLRILLSNDDGIEAPGLATLFEKLSAIGQVTVAAPSKNYSGTSHGVTSNRPIMVAEMDKNGSKWYAIDALPATCVRLAMEALLPEKPDLVVSGINSGENMGVVTFYSATVAAAREASFMGIPAISVNLQKSPAMNYADAADFIAVLAREVKDKGLRRGFFLNVNYPALPKDKIKGVLITKQDIQPSLEFYERRTSPEGKTYFLPTYKDLVQAPERTDVWAMANGYISIAPMQFDQTAYRELGTLEAWKITKWKK